MAATLGQGSLAVLNYANKIVLPVLAIGSAALATVVYPRFSRLVAERNWTDLYSQVRTYCILTLVVTIPMMIGIVLFSETLIGLLFERGEFTAADTRKVAEVQAIYALMIPTYTLGTLLARVLNAMRATRYILIGSIVIFTFNIIADYVFKEWIGIRGIALATVLNYSLSFAYNAWLVRMLIVRFVSERRTL
jgi:putative peptidoglycan lipid II flippase